jgi:hypothetical protein
MLFRRPAAQPFHRVVVKGAGVVRRLDLGMQRRAGSRDRRDGSWIRNGSPTLFSDAALPSRSSRWCKAPPRRRFARHRRRHPHRHQSARWYDIGLGLGCVSASYFAAAGQVSVASGQSHPDVHRRRCALAVGLFRSREKA